MTPERRRRLDGVLDRRQPDLTVLAENLHKPRNLSAVVRSCDAVGIETVHVVPGALNLRRHWHTSQGAEKWVRLERHASVGEACQALRADGFTLLGAHLSEQAVDYREVDYTRPTALLIGTAPQCGKIPPDWRVIIAEAIVSGLDIVSGLHEFVSDDPEFASLAATHGVELIDHRRPPERQSLPLP